MAIRVSSSGKVVYAVTNHVAFFNKEQVHSDFHPLMDFLKNSPVSYALTASPTIYAEIVQEMWSTADCTTRGEIKFTIKGNSYVLTPSVINEALHLPNSDFKTLATYEEIFGMLRFIRYGSQFWPLGHISRKHMRKEWSYFFDTLTRVFTPRCSGYDAVTFLVLVIAYSLMTGSTINIGALLLNEFAIKLGKTKEVYYARFLMVIANHFCKDLSVENRDDTLRLCRQTTVLFSYLVTKNLNAEAEFVLPEHIRVRLSSLSSSLVPPAMDAREGHTSLTRVALPSESESGTVVVTSSVSLSGKRKEATLPAINEEGDEDNEMENAVNLHPKKKVASEVDTAGCSTSPRHEE